MTYTYGFNPSSRQQAYVEFVEEASYGVFPAPNTGVPEMKWFGAITNWNDESKIKTDSKPYLADYTQTDRTMAFRNTKIGEEVGFTIDYELQQGNVMPTLCYALGGNVANPLQVSDTLTSISVGHVDMNPAANPDKAFTKFSGMLCSEYTLSIPEEGAATAKTKWVGTSKTPGADYIGTELQGSHAVDINTEVLNSDDISDFYLRESKDSPTAWGSSALCTDAVGDVELKITNKIGLPKDINTETPTKIKKGVLLSRRVTLSMSLTYADITAGEVSGKITVDNIHSFKPYDAQFTFDGHKFTMAGIRWPELPYKAGGEDLVADKLTSMPISGAIQNSTRIPPLVITAVP